MLWSDVNHRTTNMQRSVSHACNADVSPEGAFTSTEPNRTISEHEENTKNHFSSVSAMRMGLKMNRRGYKWNFNNRTLAKTMHIAPPAHRCRRQGPSWADGHKFSLVRRLSRRIFDRSKNAIATYPTGIRRPLGNVGKIFGSRKLLSSVYRAKLFAWYSTLAWRRTPG